ncbi:MAG TPA: DUF3095 domain-containing protein [Methylophilaceae bacterium]|jgi:hypothetical protein
MSQSFYQDLHALLSFAEATDSDMHAAVPDDWWIVIADVIGSTKAIEAGAYKSVNTVGVACIAAVVNVDRAISLPFVFGGDGATFAVPEVMRERVIMALRQAQLLSRDSFGLGLRVGLIRVGDLVTAGYGVKLAKVQLSIHMTQPTFSGRGWEEAERLVKTPEAAGVLRVEEDNGVADGSFEGFECRWQGVPSFNGHKLSLLIAAVTQDAAENLAIYQDVFDHIQEIYGDVASYHPLHAEKMQLAFNPKLLSHEWRVRTTGLAIAKRIGYFLKMLLTNAAGHYLFSRNLDTESVKWSQYRQELVVNSDFRKFDGMLRMVMDGSEQQSERLNAYLQEQYNKGKLAYGMYKSREALVTCIVQSYNGNHLHFVDGSDGGYALAARELKQRLKQLRDVG